jgi:hypothetical protein
VKVNWKETGIEFERTWDYNQKRLIYVAGPLNGDATQYITHLKKMIMMGERIKKELEVSVCIPGNDFLSGLVNGEMDIFHFLQGSMDLLTHCDAMMLCEGWKESKGCLNEIMEANKRNIPVFDNIGDLESWIYEASRGI